MVENRSHDQMTSSDDDDDNSADDNDSVLITELKEELPRGTILAPEWQDVVLQKSGVRKTQSVDSSEEEEEEGTHEEDWDTDLEIEGIRKMSTHFCFVDEKIRHLVMNNYSW